MNTLKTKTRNTETELRKEMEVMRKKIIFLKDQQHKNTNQFTDNKTRLEKINENTTAVQNSTTNIDNSKKEENTHTHAHILTHTYKHTQTHIHTYKHTHTEY